MPIKEIQNNARGIIPRVLLGRPKVPQLLGKIVTHNSTLPLTIPRRASHALSPQLRQHHRRVAATPIPTRPIMEPRNDRHGHAVPPRILSAAVADLHIRPAMELQDRYRRPGWAARAHETAIERPAHWRECRESRRHLGVACEAADEAGAVGFARGEDLKRGDAEAGLQVGQEFGGEEGVVYGRGGGRVAEPLALGDKVSFGASTRRVEGRGERGWVTSMPWG